MGFRIGVGGGLGLVRGGISTRGIGGGIGPLSAGASFRRHRSSSGSGGLYLLAALVVLSAVLFIFEWPYWLGTWIATQLGAGQHSAAWTAAGWIPELIYLALILIVGISYFRSRQQIKQKDEHEAIRPAIEPISVGGVGEQEPNTDWRHQPVSPPASTSGKSTMPAPAWYDDPQDARMVRFWDGAHWSPYTQPRRALIAAN